MTAGELFDDDKKTANSFPPNNHATAQPAGRGGTLSASAEPVKRKPLLEMIDALTSGPEPLAEGDLLMSFGSA